ncbi:ORFL94C [Human betaherpesvirus 5]|nr:ORFL94C [Human betaherpesvirus 5]QHX40406.1 ORFL94C [Human betaherpesvirus 5]
MALSGPPTKMMNVLSTASVVRMANSGPVMLQVSLMCGGVLLRVWAEQHTGRKNRRNKSAALKRKPRIRLRY